ncbi:adenylyltransferase/cytidyltransferase family protein [Haematomicrobium sanguinis]|uniref:adenylyltransferase/cytidyltransferase family protein n=1 Tax=Haematomicrobium sanguinis TaxID=479106 RepID=UPI00047EEA88|nr:adenylyltransferase/cytidyltransferase family protein [Haematomicrobium sanguinis]
MSEVVGYAAGAFDMFHIGHLNLLRNAAARCDRLIAGVVSDELILARKDRLPVVPLVERLEIVSRIEYVDIAVVEDRDSKLDMWGDLRFTALFKGDDWRGSVKGEELERDFAHTGVEIVYLPYTAHTSSTLLRSYVEGRAVPHVS